MAPPTLVTQTTLLSKIPPAYLKSNFDDGFFVNELLKLLHSECDNGNIGIRDQNKTSNSQQINGVGNKVNGRRSDRVKPEKPLAGNPFGYESSETSRDDEPSHTNSTSDELCASNPFSAPAEPVLPYATASSILEDKEVLVRLSKYRTTLTKLENVTQAQVRTEVQTRHSDFIQELDTIATLTDNLQDSLEVCAYSRANIKRTAERIAHPMFDLESRHHSREKLLQVSKNLKSMRHVRQQLDYLEANIHTGSLLKATDTWCTLNTQCHKQQKFSKFVALQSELTRRLDSSSLYIDAKLGTSLEKISKSEFCAIEYGETLLCYSKLGRSQNVVEILATHFSTSIQDSALSIAFAHNRIERLIEGNTTLKGLSSLDFPLVDLCKNVIDDKYLDCLTGMCSIMWSVMVNYVKLLNWHHNSTEPWVRELNNTSGFLSRLEHNKMRVWKDIEDSIKTFLTAGNLAKQFRFDQFITVLNIIGKLNDVGRDFTRIHESLSTEETPAREGPNVMGTILQESIHEQCLLYLDRYHADKLEELANYMMTETWNAVPLVDGFNLSSLSEFSFLQSRLAQSNYGGNKSAADGLANSYFDAMGYPSPFSMFSSSCTAVTTLQAHPVSQTSDCRSESSTSSKISTQLEASVHTIFSSTQKSSKIPLTNSALCLLRLTGAYLSVAHAMPIIANDVMVRLAQAIESLIVGLRQTLLVHTPDCALPRKILTLCSRHDMDGMSGLQTDSFTAKNMDLVNKPDAGCLMVAGESCVYLESQFNSLYPILKQLFDVYDDPGKSQELNDTIDFLYEESVQVLTFFVVPIYTLIVTKLFRPEISTIVSGICEGEKWTIDTIEVNHSKYVDVLVHRFVSFRSKILNLEVVTANKFESVDVLWRCSGREIFQIFLKGISQVQYCTHQGRAKMQLDFQQLLVKLSALTNLKFEKEASSVKEYIQAFYMSDENEIEAWVASRKDLYTQSSLLGLVTVYCNANKIDKKIRRKIIDDHRLDKFD